MTVRVMLDNIIFDLQQVGGVSAVWCAVIEASMRDPGVAPTFIAAQRNAKCAVDSDLIARPHVPDRRLPLSIRRYMDVAVETDADIFHSSYFRVHRSRNIKQVVTVHDCIYEKFVRGPRRWAHLFQKRRALRRADAVISVSQSTKRDLLTYYPWLQPDLIHVVPNGVSTSYSQLPSVSDSAARCNRRSYLLYVGSRRGHKNFSCVLDLLESGVARTLNLSLIIAGGGPVSKNERSLIAARQCTQHVEHVGFVTEQKLNELYNGAFALVYPSFYEGFGIPPLEAMSAGCPVICSNAASLPEVVGNAALMFSPHDAASAIEHLNLLAESSARSAIIASGKARAALFSWAETGKKTVQVYKDLARA